MHFGYPGENTHLEHHGVSEESFWPSFTDIMMVIVMVFLLVTVAVILNNWTLISDLKNSIQAQEIASSLAENTQEQNHTLEEKLSSLERQVILLNTKYQTEKTSHLASQQELAKLQRILLEKETSLNELETAVSTGKTSLDASKTELAQKVQLALALQAQLDSSNQQKNKSQELFEKLQVSLDSEKRKVKEFQTVFGELEKTKKNLEQMLQSTTKTVDELEKEKLSLIRTYNEKLNQRDSALIAKDKEYLALKEKQDDRDSKLRSLQGEYTSLDAKYQKLLLPARSSKGKYVVSVLYRKTGGRRIIRLKSSPGGSYTVVTEKNMHSQLTQLKNKHKKNLYLKVVIPENSGLSYSEAWKFTSGLQKRYDYYFQDSQ